MAAIRCHFCHATVADVDATIEANWWPSFDDNRAEVAEPFCPACATRHLVWDEDAQTYVRPLCRVRFSRGWPNLQPLATASASSWDRRGHLIERRMVAGVLVLVVLWDDGVRSEYPRGSLSWAWD